MPEALAEHNVDSKVVNKELRKTVRPLMRSLGFNKFTARTAWRHTSHRVEIVNIQSFNSYTADVVGVTTYSFSVNLGSYVTCVPPHFAPDRVKREGQVLLPAEYECHLRGSLTRSFGVPETDRSDIWYIGPEAQHLADSVDDVSDQLRTIADPWFHRLRDDATVLDVLLDSGEDMDRLWGFGRLGSPIRNYMTGYLALAVGQQADARDFLIAAADSGSFSTVEERLREDAHALG